MLEKKAPKKAGRKPATVDCITLRKIGLDSGMSEVDQLVSLPKDVAKRLQDAGAVKVKL